MFPTVVRRTAALLAGVLLLGLGACDSDDAADGDTGDFCGLIAEASDLSIDPTSAEGLEEVRAVYVRIEGAAPEEVADDVGALVDAIEGISSGEINLSDPDRGEELAAASQHVDEYVATECPDVTATTSTSGGGG